MSESQVPRPSAGMSLSAAALAANKAVLRIVLATILPVLSVFVYGRGDSAFGQSWLELFTVKL